MNKDAFRRMRARLEGLPEDPGPQALADEVAVTSQPDDPFTTWEVEYRHRGDGVEATGHWHDDLSLEDVRRYSMTVRGRFYLESRAHDASLCRDCRLAILELLKEPPPKSVEFN